MSFRQLIDLFIRILLAFRPLWYLAFILGKLIFQLLNFMLHNNCFCLASQIHAMKVIQPSQHGTGISFIIHPLRSPGWSHRGNSGRRFCWWGRNIAICHIFDRGNVKKRRASLNRSFVHLLSKPKDSNLRASWKDSSDSPACFNDRFAVDSLP